ncbi:hypothetical protein Tco_0119075, partial [Tanacetum coccineum]
MPRAIIGDTSRTKSSLTAQFGQILRIPYNGQTVFTNEWDLASLAYSQEIKGPYHTNLPTPDDIRRFLQLEQEQYNLAYFFVKRIECARATPNANLPYDMFLTLDRVMCPLALKQTRKPQSDRGMPKARHSISSSSAHHYGSSSHHGDDNEDDDASRASTPSPTTYLNSLSPLNY